MRGTDFTCHAKRAVRWTVQSKLLTSSLGEAREARLPHARMRGGADKRCDPPSHLLPEPQAHETVGLAAIKAIRATFDRATGWDNGTSLTEAKCLQRIIFLETLAGVPGMVAGMLRHMRSLRTMKRDHGW